MQSRITKTYKLPATKTHKPPMFLVLIATLTGMAIALPLTYLVICTVAMSREQLWTLVSRPRT